MSILSSLTILSLILSTQAVENSLNLMFSNKQYTYSLADYGVIPYGETLEGIMYLAPTKADDDLSLCSMEAVDDRSSYFSQSGNKWMVIRRGGCGFVRKSFYAQSMGAQLVIIVNNMEGDVNNILLSDDGYGTKVTIPTILISQEDGESLINSLKLKQPSGISDSITFNEITKSDKSNVKLALSITNRNSFNFLNEFTQWYQHMKDHVVLNLVYYVSCANCGIQVNLTNDCLGGGEYCIADPDGDGPANGVDIIEEQLRQTCLWQYDQAQWWDYMTHFQNVCTSPNQYDQCFNGYINSDVQQQVNNCVKSSYYPRAGATDAEDEWNTILDNQWSQVYLYKLINFPRVIINNFAFRGSFYYENWVNAICSSLSNQNICPTINTQMWLDESYESDSDTVTIVMISVFVPIGTIILLIVLFIVWRKYRATPIHQSPVTSKDPAIVESPQTLPNQNDYQENYII